MQFLPLDIDKYYTIDAEYRSEIKVKGSKFIATSIPVETKELAMEQLERIRAEFYDATHNCYAYRIGWDGAEFRAADDGEPAGSAGKPILFSIDKYNLQNILVVVTRYFGGTKLGVGGLVRAYSDSAEETLKIVKPKVVHRTELVFIECGYEDISFVKRTFDEFAISFEEDYAENVKFSINIPISKVDRFVNLIFANSNGKLKVNKF